MPNSFRKLRFWLVCLPRWMVDMPQTLILCAACKRTALSTYKGITIAVASWSRSSEATFLASTIEALQLVERTDPRRFKRIQQHVRYIVHADLPSSACYNRLGRICLLDYRRYRFQENHDWYLYCYASILVHEATHGAINSYYIPDIKPTHLRLEKLCHLEERRFLQRLATENQSWVQKVAGEFDEQYYSEYYNRNWFAKWQKIWKRIRQVRKDV